MPMPMLVPMLLLEDLELEGMLRVMLMDRQVSYLRLCDWICYGVFNCFTDWIPLGLDLVLYQCLDLLLVLLATALYLLAGYGFRYGTGPSGTGSSAKTGASVSSFAPATAAYVAPATAAYVAPAAIYALTTGARSTGSGSYYSGSSTRSIVSAGLDAAGYRSRSRNGSVTRSARTILRGCYLCICTRIHEPAPTPWGDAAYYVWICDYLRH
ncbi:hypothetical protein SUGI_1225330 [Cryptomeria japonica]|uniref:Uncharacterized protein n=1 Tax=Cryptomeria japonica TaxID=3369 RepID=A0AAD3RPR7_CRYJA|nr:hypothetical protein SUGI_1225330 [Cryptomeria japonica]